MVSIFVVRSFPFVGFKAHLTRRTFIVLDGLGLHVSFAGHEVAYTRGFGWVVG
jgi:hypothetical protein